jgi:hypothetical protein
MNVKWGIVVGALVLGIVIGVFVGGFSSRGDASPYCPTEDSCHIDFRNGEWHITEEVR